MSEYVLEANNITKVFPGVRALDNVSIRLRKGEVLGLIGENGAGKSTLLKVLNGIYPYGNYEGEIKMFEENCAFKSPHDALAKGIGYVPQEINVMDVLSVAENILVGHLKEEGAHSISKQKYIKRAEQLMKEMKMDLDPSLRVQYLSIGQKQFLMLLRALSWNPKVMILDEPTTSLSKEEVDTLFETVRRIAAKGTSIIFVTHKLEEILEPTDRVTVLRDGSNVGEYEKKDYSRDALISAMVGREITNLYPTKEPHIGEEVLRIEGLTVEHPKIKDRTLINDVSFYVRAGEVLGLVGLVGAGRTETVSTIFGQYPLKSGVIYLKGKKAEIKNEADAIAQGLSYVTEDRKGNGLLMLADIKTNVVLSNLKAIKGRILLSRKKERETANKYMERLNIKAPTMM